MIWQLSDRELKIGKTLVMGVLNVTPDSFSDGGRFAVVDKALAQAEAIISAGADILDIGGESSRPGVTPVPEQEELDRVMPILEGLKNRDALISKHGSLVDRRQKAGVIHDLAAAKSSIPERDIRGQLVAFAAETVADPGADAGMAQQL